MTPSDRGHQRGKDRKVTRSTGRGGESLTRTRAKRWARGQGTRTHAEAGAERRGHVAQQVTAAGTSAVVDDWAGGIGAKPMAAEIALRIDALNGEAGQVLHNFFPQRRLAARKVTSDAASPEKQNVDANCGAGFLWCQDKMLLDVGVLLRGCGNWLDFANPSRACPLAGLRESELSAGGNQGIQ